MKYTVLVTRDSTESAYIKVEADSKEDAAETALDLAACSDASWELNDGGSYEPYLGAGIDDDVTEEGEQAVIR